METNYTPYLVISKRKEHQLWTLGRCEGHTIIMVLVFW